MPTYKYQCGNEFCMHEFELFQQISENPKRKCKKCGRMKLVRLIGAGAGVIFKGKGWYSKDYNGKNASDGSQ